MNRVAFLVDGFNLYHSLRDASDALGGAGTRWLDLRGLCASFLHLIGPDARLLAVHHFSAIPIHLEATKPGVTERHRGYLECLLATGIIVELGEFKAKYIRCPECHSRIVRHEEKETDVAIAVRLFDLFSRAACDSVVVVTGDSDLAPAIREARARFPDMQVYSCFPYRRDSHGLRKVATATFRIRAERYARHQLPDPMVLPDGSIRRKPANW